MWEDEANKHGGRWTLKVSKGFTNKLWEDLILAMIGEQFTLENEINGIVLSIRGGLGDKISIWNRNGKDKEIVEKIKEDIVSILQLPEHVMMDYHAFNYLAEPKSKEKPQSTRQLKPARV
jgi:translation initiation factor 4E